MQELLPGLWRWTAKHPSWRGGAEPDSPDDWPEDVGCVAYAAPRSLVLIDPLVPDDAFLDDLVERHDGAVSILQTVRFHGRSREALERRYADRLAPEPGPGVEPVPIAGAGESMVWLSEPRTLVPGDRLLGGGRGGLRMCPDSWMRYLDLDQAALAEALRPLLDLPVEHVLVSHGEPVLGGGRAAIARAIGYTPS
ncbi:MAG TPA: hypothetical protein VGW10_10830 [Solirubrobacteraceae bacterium]|nr:hypothetical protein [Solirubrobacteraceae bacterium]